MGFLYSKDRNRWDGIGKGMGRARQEDRKINGKKGDGMYRQEDEEKKTEMIKRQSTALIASMRSRFLSKL
jgi:hypothetical protein